jgi:hypothetical protein
VRPSSSNLIRSAKRDSDGFLKLESLDFFETPSPTEFGRKNCGLKARGKVRQKAAMNLPLFAAMTGDILPPLAALCHRQLPEVVAICRRARRSFIAF